MNTQRKLTLMALLVLSLAVVASCAAPQDASKARSRGLINQGIIVPAEEVRVAEYLNYYEQRFPEPVNEPLGLDLRLGNPQIPASGGEVWLQIGLQARSPEADAVTPVNLALVIDKSGSMDAPDKMPYLKESLRVFFESLRPDDMVSVVAYDDDARVLLPAQLVGDGAWIQRTIAGLQPGGSTNLHGGLMLGLQEVDRNYDIRRNNRVILLTDGIANQGVTDPQQIAAAAKSYNDKGIYLSTIGLGLDFNDELLSTLARQGQGSYHFVDSAEEMDKVFREAAASLVQKVAGNVAVSVKPAAGVSLLQVSGFEGQPPATGAQVQMQDMGAGASQVMLARLAVPPGAAGTRHIADVTLTYTDLFAQRPRESRGPVTAKAVTGGPYDPLADVEILRNVTIQRSAEGLQAISWMTRQDRYAEALALARDLEQQLRAVAALTVDEQMVKDADLFRRYQLTLEENLRVQGRPVQSEATFTSPVQPQRWGPQVPTPTPALPVIEVR